MDEEKPPTHTAYVMKRDGRANIRWLEIGRARIEIGGDVHHVYLDRLPTGGFSGHVCLAPIGVEPGLPELRPRRPDLGADDPA